MPSGKTGGAEPDETPRLFSYSREDSDLRKELAKHLSSLRRQGVLEDWSDEQIRPGEEWSEEIERQLRQADLVLLLISPSFINSHYCYEVELPIAMERHEQGLARVVPIRIRPVHLTGREPFSSYRGAPGMGDRLSPGETGAKPGPMWWRGSTRP